MKRLNNFLLLCLFGILCTVASAMAQVPSIQAKNIVFYGSDANGYIVRCTRGNGNGRVLVAQKLEGSETASGVDWLDAAALEAAVSNFPGADQPAEYSLATLTTEPVIVANLTGTNREVTVNGLNGGENIAYRVYEYNKSGSNYVFNTDTPSLNPRGKTFIAVTPTIAWDENAITQTATTINLKWTVNGTFSYYTLDVIKNDFSGVVYSNLDIGTENSFLVDGLTAATTYMCRVTGYTASGAVATDWKFIETGAAVAAPALSTSTISINGKIGGTLNAADVTKPLSLVLTFNQAMDPGIGSVVLNNATFDADNIKNKFTETARSWSNDNKILTLTYYTIGGISADEPAITAALNGFANVDGTDLSNTTTDPLFSIDVTAPVITNLSAEILDSEDNSKNSIYAKAGEKIKFTFTSDVELTTPAINITGKEAVECSTVSTGTPYTYTAEYTVLAGDNIELRSQTYADDTPGVSDYKLGGFTIAGTDAAGNPVAFVGTESATPTTGDINITVDTKAPVISALTAKVDGSADKHFATTGSKITIIFTSDEALADTPTVNLGKQADGTTEIIANFAAGENALIYTAEYTVATGDDINIKAEETAVESAIGVSGYYLTNLTITGEDLAGNAIAFLNDSPVTEVYAVDVATDFVAPTFSVEMQKRTPAEGTEPETYEAATTFIAGDEVKVTFTAYEELATTPAPVFTVKYATIEGIEGIEGIYDNFDIGTVAVSGNEYSYTFTIADQTVAEAFAASKGALTLAFTASGTDLAGNIGDAVTPDAPYKADPTKPTFAVAMQKRTSAEPETYETATTFAIDDEVKVTITASEELATTPAPVFTVKYAGETIANTNIATENITFDVDDNDPKVYTATFTIAEQYTFEDKNALTLAFTASGTDLAGNASGVVVPTGGSYKADPTKPAFTISMVKTDDPAATNFKAGDEVTISFTASEELNADPAPTFTVKYPNNLGDVTAANVPVITAANNVYSSKFTIAAKDFTSKDYLTLIFSASGTDAAGNASGPIYINTPTYKVDPTVPVISNLSAKVDDDADKHFAKVGSVITISFTSDEELTTPAVTLGTSVGAAIITKDGLNYTATYTVVAGDNIELRSQTYADATPGVSDYKLGGFTIAGTDAAGNPVAFAGAEATEGDVNFCLTIDTKAPTATLAASVAKSNKSARTDGYAQTGDVITFTLTASEAIATPTVAFKVGNDNITTTFEKSTTTTDGTVWTATYTVVANSPQGLVALNSDTYTITDLAGNESAACSTFTATPNVGITVDTDVPGVTSLVASVKTGDDDRTDGWAQAGDVITFTLTADEVLKAAPTATFTVGGSDITTTTFEKSTTTTDGTVWTATYTVPAYVDATTTPQGLVALKDATYIVTDLAGNESAACSTFTTVPNDGITVDTDVPAITNLAAKVDDDADKHFATTGSKIKIIFTSDEALAGTPTVNLGTKADGTTKIIANFAAGENALIYTAEYTVVAGDNIDIKAEAPATATEDEISDYFLSGVTITGADAAGNAIAFETTNPENNEYAVDVKTDFVAPTITDLAVTAGTGIGSNYTAATAVETVYYANANGYVKFTFKSNEPLALTGNSKYGDVFTSITINDGTNTNNVINNLTALSDNGGFAETAPTAPATKYTYTVYVPAAAIADKEGTLSYTINVKDLAGNASANYTTSNEVADPATSVYLDGIAPTLTSANIASNNNNPTWAKAGDVVTFTFTADKAIKGLTTDNIKLFAAAELANVTVESDDDITWTATYTVANDSPEGNVKAVVSGITDLAGNAIVGTEITVGDASAFTTPAGGIVANNIITFNATTPNTTDDSHVTIDVTAPANVTAKAESNNSSKIFAKTGDVITFTISNTNSDEAFTPATNADNASTFGLNATSIAAALYPAEQTTPTNSWTYAYTVLAADEGEAYISMVVKDLAGNEASVTTLDPTVTVLQLADLKAPEITKVREATTGWNQTVSGNCELTYKVEKPAVAALCTLGYTSAQNGGTTYSAAINSTYIDKNTSVETTKKFNELFDWTLIPAGSEFTLTFTATDAAGNKQESNSPYYFTKATAEVVASSVTLSAITNPVCQGTANVTITATPVALAASSKYQWFSSTDGTAWTAIGSPTAFEAEATTATFTVPTLEANLGSTWYRIAVSNDTICPSVVESAPVQVIVKPHFPAITATPQYAKSCLGASNKITTTGAPASTTYSWYSTTTEPTEQNENTVWNEIAGQTAAVYTLANGITEKTWFKVKAFNNNYCEVAAATTVIDLKPTLETPAIASTLPGNVLQTTAETIELTAYAPNSIPAGTTLYTWEYSLNSDMSNVSYLSDSTGAPIITRAGANTVTVTIPEENTVYVRVKALNVDYCGTATSPIVTIQRFPAMDGTVEITNGGFSAPLWRTCIGADITLTATYTAGTNNTLTDVTYQWYKDGVALTNTVNLEEGATDVVSGATTATLTLSNVAAADATTYTVKVAKDGFIGTVNDDFALTVGPRMPAVAISDLTICADVPNTLTVTGAPTDGTTYYSWRKVESDTLPAGNSEVWGETIAYTTVNTYEIPANTINGTTWFMVIAYTDGYCNALCVYAKVELKPNMPTPVIAGVSGDLITTTNTKELTVNFGTGAEPEGTTYTWKWATASDMSGSDELEAITNTATVSFPETTNMIYVQVTATNAKNCPATGVNSTIATIRRDLTGDVTIAATGGKTAICAGGTTKLTANYAGGNAETLTYTWYKGSVESANVVTTGAANELTITEFAEANASDYFVVVTATGYYGTAVSQAFALTLNPEMPTPVLVDQNVALPATSATLTAGYGNASAPESTTYTWKWSTSKSGDALSGTINTVANQNDANATIDFSGLLSMTDIRTFYVQVTASSENYCGTKRSNVATINFTPAMDGTVAITYDNSTDNASVCENSNVTFTATYTAGTNNTSTDVTYQWYKDETALGGATTATLTLANVASANSGTYRVEVGAAGYAGVVSDGIALTVEPRMSALTATVGTSPVCPDVANTITVSGAPATGVTTYAWYKVVSATQPTTWGDAINGATTNVYSVTANEVNATTWFKVVASNTLTCGEQEAITTITVKPTATVDGNDFALTATTGGNAIISAIATEVPTGTAVNFTVNIATDLPAGVAIPTTFAWTVNDVAQASIASTFSYAAQTAGPVTVTVKFTPTLADGYCGTLTEQTRTFTYNVAAAPITVSISANVNDGAEVCSDANVVLTATAENVPDGVTPTYAWQKYNGPDYEVVNGANDNTLTPTLTAGTTYNYKAVVTVGDNSYTSDAFTFAVKPNLPNTTVASENVAAQCQTADGTVTLTATVTNAPNGATASYQWYTVPATGGDAEIIENETSATYAASIAAAGTTIYKVVVSYSDHCGTIEATKDVVVKPVLAKPTLAATETTVCSTDGVALTMSEAATGATNKVYRSTAQNFLENTIDVTPISGTQITDASATNATATPITYYYRVTAEAGNTYCTDVVSDVVEVVVKPNLPNTTVAIENVTAQCPTTDGTVTLTATVTNAPNGATPSYQWYTVPATGGDAEINGATSATYAASIAAAGTTTYKVVVSYSDHCGTIEATKDVVVNSQLATPAITAKVGEGDNATTFCLGDEITFTATAIEGATYTWEYLNGTDGVAANNAQGVNNVNQIAWTPTAAASYTLRVTASKENVCPATSEEFTYIVRPTAEVTEDNFALTATAGGNAIISAIATEVPTGTAVNFTVADAPTGVVAPTAYAWYIGDSQTAVAGQTESTFAYTAEIAGPVTVTVKFTPTVSTNYCGSITEQTRTFTYSVVATPITVSISANGVANNGSVCSDANVVLTATAENVPEGVTPIYAWQKLSGAEYVDVTTDDGLEIYNTFSPYLTTNAHTYRAVVTVNNTNYTTGDFTLTVHQAYTANNVSVAIAASAEVNLAAVPAGTEVTFTATPNPANLTYTYQWYVNGAAVTGATNATYTYTAPAAGTIGYVYCVATLNDGTICKDASWNGEKTSNTAAVTAIVNSNALGTFSNFSLVSKKKISAKLTWTRANESDNVVIIIKPILSGGLPTNIASGSFLDITEGINANYTAATAAIDDYKVVYKGNNIGGLSTTDTLEITGLSRSTNYTAFAFICNSDYTQNTTEPVRVTFKTNAYKEAYEITDPNFDGEFSLSPINPNPITGDEMNFNIDSWVNANYEIELFNSNGDYITGMTQMLSEGIHSMKLDLNSQKGGLNSGAYVLRVTSNGQTLSQPVRIVR